MPSVLITGAGRGFGRALLDVYSGRGWTVFPLARDPRVAAELASACGPACHPISGDVSSPEIERQIAETLQKHGPVLDVLVNNAGNVKKLRWLPNPVAEDIEDLFRVHCVGAFRCARAALPHLRRAQNPVIVNITSRWGSIGRTVAGQFRGIYSYQIAKCAQNMLTACLDHELKGEGIRVFAVHPGQLKTDAGAVDADTDPRDAAVKLADWIQSCHPGLACGCHDLLSGGMIEW